jgi:hypothetical protein
MSNPENASGHSEMGSGRDEYSKLGGGFTHAAPEVANRESVGSTERYNERDRYRALAEAARGDGHVELADKFEQYATEINTDLIDAFVKRHLDETQQAKQRMIDAGSGHKLLATILPGGEFSEAALAAIREEMLAHEDLAGATLERTEEPDEPGTYVVRYTVPLQNGIIYAEEYDEEFGFTDITIDKN